MPEIRRYSSSPLNGKDVLSRRQGKAMNSDGSQIFYHIQPAWSSVPVDSAFSAKSTPVVVFKNIKKSWYKVCILTNNRQYSL